MWPWEVLQFLYDTWDYMSYTLSNAHVNIVPKACHIFRGIRFRKVWNSWNDLQGHWRSLAAFSRPPVISCWSSIVTVYLVLFPRYCHSFASCTAVTVMSCGNKRLSVHVLLLCAQRTDAWCAYAWWKLIRRLAAAGSACLLTSLLPTHLSQTRCNRSWHCIVFSWKWALTDL